MNVSRFPLIALSLLASLAFGGEAVPPAELPPLIYAPASAKGFDPQGQGVWLPYERFRSWWDRAHPQPEPTPAAPITATITEFTATGTVDGQRASFAVQVTVVAAASGWSTVRLPGTLPLTRLAPADARVVVERSARFAILIRPGDTLSGLALRHLADANRWQELVQANPGLDPQKLAIGSSVWVPLPAPELLIHVPGPGVWKLDGEAVVAVELRGDGRSALHLPLPLAGAVRVALDLDVDGSEIAMTSPGAWSRQTGNGKTRLIAAPLGEALDLAWRVAPAAAAAVPAVITADSALVASVGPGSVVVSGIITAGIARRQLDALTLRVPAGWQLIAVDGTQVARWSIVGDLATISLNGLLQGEVELNVRLEQTLPEAGGAAVVAWPSLAGTATAAGTLAITARDGVEVVPGNVSGLQRIDPAEAGGGALLAAWRFHADPPPLPITVTRSASELRIESATLIRLGAEETLITARFAIDVRRAGTFQLALLAPRAWELIDTDGPAVDEVRGEDVPDTLHSSGLRRHVLALRTRLIGQATLTVRLRAAPGPSGIDLAAVRVEGARAQRGALVVAAPRAWALTVGARHALAGADPAELLRLPLAAPLAAQVARDEEAALAFTWLGADVAPTARIAAAARARELTAAIEDRITVADGQLRRAIRIHGEVRYNPAATLRLAVPSAWGEAFTVRAAGLAERVAAGAGADGLAQWELRFQPPILGAYQLTIEAAATAPRLAAGAPTAVAVPAIAFPDAQRVTYVAGIARDGAIDVTVSAPGLETVAPADLPAALGQNAVAGVQGPGPAALTLTATRQDLVALAEAGVARAAWTVVVAQDGSVRLRGRMLVTSRARTQVAIALPAGATLIEAAVDGRTARVSRREDGAVVLPMPADGGDHRLALVVESRTAVPTALGSIAVELPHLAATAGAPGIPVARTEATLWLARSWRIGAWSGDLAPDAEVDAMPPGDGDGLSVPVPGAGRSYAAARVGDGGTLAVEVVHERLALVLAVLGAAAGLAAAWLLRRRPTLVAALCTAIAAAAALAIATWQVIALVTLAGAVAGAALALLAGWWRLRRVVNAAVEPERWIEKP